LRAGNELWQVFAFLRRAAVAPDLVDAQVRVRAVGKPDRRGSARDLLHRDNVGEVAHHGAAVVFLDRDAQEAELAELGPQIARKLVRAVDLGGARRDFLPGEVLHRFAQHGKGLAVIEVEKAHVGDYLTFT